VDLQERREPGVLDAWLRMSAATVEGHLENVLPKVGSRQVFSS